MLIRRAIRLLSEPAFAGIKPREAMRELWLFVAELVDDMTQRLTGRTCSSSGFNRSASSLC